MDKSNPSEKFEIIEQALQESIGGGVPQRDICAITCSIFSRDVCNINICSFGEDQR